MEKTQPTMFCKPTVAKRTKATRESVRRKEQKILTWITPTDKLQSPGGTRSPDNMAEP
jgi:hypothetical protein